MRHPHYYVRCILARYAHSVCGKALRLSLATRHSSLAFENVVLLQLDDPAPAEGVHIRREVIVDTAVVRRNWKDNCSRRYMYCIVVLVH